VRNSIGRKSVIAALSNDEPPHCDHNDKSHSHYISDHPRFAGLLLLLHELHLPTPDYSESRQRSRAIRIIRFAWIAGQRGWSNGLSRVEELSSAAVRKLLFTRD
jgi:hypothetical protein